MFIFQKNRPLLRGGNWGWGGTNNRDSTCRYAIINYLKNTRTSIFRAKALRQGASSGVWEKWHALFYLYLIFSVPGNLTL